MSLQEVTIYMALRTLQWAGLFLAQVIHTSRNQGQTRKLFQLTNALALSVGLFAHRDFWVTILSIAYDTESARLPLTYISSLFDGAYRIYENPPVATNACSVLSDNRSLILARLQTWQKPSFWCVSHI
jgi:predicted transcriptional regulator